MPSNIKEILYSLSNLDPDKREPLFASLMRVSDLESILRILADLPQRIQDSFMSQCLKSPALPAQSASESTKPPQAQTLSSGQIVTWVDMHSKFRLTKKALKILEKINPEVIHDP